MENCVQKISLFHCKLTENKAKNQYFNTESDTYRQVGDSACIIGAMVRDSRAG